MPACIMRFMNKRWLLLAPVSIALATALAMAASPAPADATFDVKQYGAVGDGTTMNTAALQKAIDAAAAAGGGTVVFPAGRYLSG